MCLLAVCEPGSTPKRKDLECASCNNPHGFGYAVIANGEIITGRGMSAKKVISEFLSVRKQYPNGYAMFHARFATHGVKNVENCHPFPVGGSKLISRTTGYSISRFQPMTSVVIRVCLPRISFHSWAV
jgi:hypothetical protein